MNQLPVLVPQRGIDRIYEMVKNRLWLYEFQGLSEQDITEKMHLINVSYSLAKLAHRNQIREWGEDYFKDHILAVMKIYLDELRGDSLEWVLTAFFHDCPEDTEKVDLYVIGKVIGQQVAHNVDYLTKPWYEYYLTPEQKDAYELLQTPQERKSFLKPLKATIKPILVQAYFQKMRAWANDTTILIKAADRIHNLRTLPDDARWIEEYIIETEQYIVPLLEERNMTLPIMLIQRELAKLKLRLHTLKHREGLNSLLSESG